jgi:hypothetical protein
MNEQDYDVARALAGLRIAVRGAVWPPAAATLRARAEHRLRTRRLSAVAVAAVVIAVAVGVTAVARNTATPPPRPPGETSTPPTAGPPSPRPDRTVPPYPVNTVDDPIARVDWANATLPVPPRAGCPSGNLRFRDGQTSGYPRMHLDTKAREGRAAPVYGDLTGDGRLEAVLYTSCQGGPQSDHSTDQLLVFGRDQSGAVRAVGWAGPVGWGVVADFWLEGDRIVIDPSPDTETQASIGATQVYRWRDGRFRKLDGLPGIQPVTDDRPGAPMDLGPADGPVARSLGCPGGPVRIDGPAWKQEATTDRAIYDFTTTPGLPHLFDLAGDGRRYLLVAIVCLNPQTYDQTQGQQPEDLLGNGLVVFDRTADGGFRAVDAVPAPTGLRVASWIFDRGRLSIEYYRLVDGVGVSPPEIWVWNGEYLQRGR